MRAAVIQYRHVTDRQTDTQTHRHTHTHTHTHTHWYRPTDNTCASIGRVRKNWQFSGNWMRTVQDSHVTPAACKLQVLCLLLRLLRLACACWMFFCSSVKRQYTSETIESHERHIVHCSAGTVDFSYSHKRFCWNSSDNYTWHRKKKLYFDQYLGNAIQDET